MGERELLPGQRYQITRGWLFLAFGQLSIAVTPITKFLKAGSTALMGFYWLSGREVYSTTE